MSIKFKAFFPKNDPLTDGSGAGLCQYMSCIFIQIAWHNKTPVTHATGAQQYLTLVKIEGWFYQIVNWEAVL